MYTRLLSSMFAMGLCLTLGGITLNPSEANALSIRVSQETTAGAGNFDSNVLGYITSYDTPLTTSGFYNFSGASYNGQTKGGPPSISNGTQLFFVNASDGLSLVVVHDKPNDGTSGNAYTYWNLLGDTATLKVKDDSSEFGVSGGGTIFSGNHSWVGCCTDGYAIGSLDNDWTLYGKFNSFAGLSSWQATSANGSHLALGLNPGRNVRLDLYTPEAAAPSTVPEPTTLVLMGSGLAGLLAWRKKTASQKN